MSDKTILQRIEDIENRLYLLENNVTGNSELEYRYSKKFQSKMNQRDNIDKLMSIVGIK